MRILSVRLKNLNSLTGEWFIDFTHPDYASDGIFAITGPTGAGKTTILDAVCLGLYGRTPRLDKVTKSGNEIMSRQTGECFAEVTFETQKGRWRCHWSQRRARKRPDGELQPAKHEVADAGSGALVESRITQVSTFMENATGMDFERFTRSMMLAQGGFSAFLAASPDERAPILEQITGTGIYSDISVKVHERRAHERALLDELQAGMKGIRVFDVDEERGLHAALKEKLSREKELEGMIEGLRKAEVWREGIMRLEKDLLDLEKQWKDFSERREAFAPEAEKLQRSLKALGLEGDYRASRAFKAQQDEEINELEKSRAALPEKEKARAEMQEKKESAESAQNDMRSRQSREAELIKEVRRLDARLGEQKRQWEDKEKALQVEGKQREEYRRNMENTARAVKKAEAELKTAQDYLAAHAADAALLTNLAVIARQFASLREAETGYEKACGDLAGVAEAREAFTKKARKAEEDHEQSRRKFEERQREHRLLCDGLATLLKGREVSDWREEGEAARDRERLLVRLAATFERLRQASATLKTLHDDLSTLKTDREKLAAEIGSHADRSGLLEKDIAGLETQVALLGRIRDLEEERKRLRDGTPCPLCGAIDHPYARGNVPELSAAEATLSDARARFKEASEELVRLEAGQAGTAQKILHKEKEITDATARQKDDERSCLDDLTRLGMECTPEGGAGKVDEELAALKERISEISRTIAMADDMSRKLGMARNAAETLRAEVDASGRTVQDMTLKFQTADIEYAQLRKTRDTLEKDRDGARREALKDVEPFGITDVALAGLDTILRGLTERRLSWQGRIDGRAALERTIHDFTAQFEKEQALEKSLEKDIAAREEERSSLVKSYEALQALRRERFGDKDPDEEEKRLADSVEAAGLVLEKAREEYGKADKDLGALKESVEILTLKTSRRARELAHADERLAGRIAEAGFEDMADYLSSRLSEEERETLDGRQKSAINEKTELETRRKDKSAVLAGERALRLTDEPLETIVEKKSASESELKQIRLDIGGISENLKENERQKEKQKGAMEIVDARRRECLRWDDLHLLIGSADGKKFRNFAQGLTFEIMVAHANRRLREMSDRYVLIRDPSQPLELNVIDNYQAGEVRSTKNLSGGESFIVSLALALGLSQMASRTVRVDSLFLDEGFGSLDEDTLETALETLAGLKDTGKLIGVISHVPALKERIGTQIQVAPKSGGVSTISGPGCSRWGSGLLTP